MSARLLSRASLIVVGVAAMPYAALADGLVIPGYGQSEADRDQVRPYRAAVFPPQQYNILGQPVPPPDLYARPSYRQTPFPPENGRYGGGFIEMLMTGETDGPSRRAPVPAYAPAAYAQPAPSPVYAARRATLPQTGLPDYTPQPPAYYGSRPNAQGAAQQQAYAQQAAYAPQSAADDPIANDPGLTTRPINPIYQRQDVAYEGRERPGTIIIDTPDKFLFLVQPGGRALRYGIGVGRPGFAWAGVKTISRKAEWPGWTPPAEMLARRPDLPRHMDGGPANPLGARALYLGSSLYRIHGTNEPYTIGTNVSSGCIRMMNDDVVDLYGRVGVGTRVIVL
jgi:lipoprotein-anchoring transpeptidase ErfK/SrfK